MNKQIFFALVFLIISTIESKDAFKETNSVVQKLRDLPIQQIRPRNSNTQSYAAIKFNFHDEQYGGRQSANFRGDALRSKRDPKNTHSLASIRRRLNEEKALKKDDIMVLDSNSGMEHNYTGVPPHTHEVQYGGINTEQNRNKENDKMRLLYAYRNNEQEIPYFFPGTECNFERSCPWKWKTDSSGGFFVSSPDSYENVDDGPEMDADNKSTGLLIFIATIIIIILSMFVREGASC